MKNISIIITLFVLFLELSAQSPYQNVMISNQSAPNEVSICINPKNTNQLVAGANLNSYYYSSNAGLNWTRGTLVDNQNGVWGDPVIIVDTNQHFYYFHLSNPTSGSWIDRIVCQKSTNAGMNWSNPGSYMGLDPLYPLKDQDKEWACVDRRSGPRGNWLYCTWTQFDLYNSNNPTDSSTIRFSRSTDGGLSWSTAIRISKQGGDCKDGDYTVEGAVPCVGPNGEIYVSWAGPLSPSNFRIFFDKSTDGGSTWLANDIIAATHLGGWDVSIPGIQRCNGMPITACDVSGGPYNGRIYINYTDSINVTDNDVKLVRSTDGGNTWSSPLRVNNDAPGKNQFFTWMTLDQVTGYIYIVFYDRRNYTDNQTDVYLARSTDGGVTFSNERISESPFLPSSSYFFGDYNNITAHNGKVRPMWVRLVSGSLSVWTAIIEFPVGTNISGAEIPDNFELFQNYPNPFNPVTKIRFSIPAPIDPPGGGKPGTRISLVVYDILGKEVAVLLDKDLKPGSYEINWDASGYSSGVYYYTLNAGLYKETKKMAIVK